MKKFIIILSFLCLLTVTGIACKSEEAVTEPTKEEVVIEENKVEDVAKEIASEIVNGIVEEEVGPIETNGTE